MKYQFLLMVWCQRLFSDKTVPTVLIMWFIYIYCINNVYLFLLVIYKQKRLKMNNEKFYTVEKAAELLNSNPQTIRKLIKDNKILAVKKLGKWFIMHSDIIEFLNE